MVKKLQVACWAKTWEEIFAFLRKSLEHIKLLSLPGQILTTDSPEKTYALAFPSEIVLPFPTQEALVENDESRFQVQDETYNLCEHRRGDSLLLNLPLAGWSREKKISPVLLWIDDKELLSQVISQALAFERHKIYCASLRKEEEEAFLAEIHDPPYFLLQEWRELQGCQIFYQGRENIFLAWGWDHPFLEFIQSPKEEWHFVLPPAQWKKIPIPQLQSLYDFLEVEIPSSIIEKWKSSRDAPQVKISLSLGTKNPPAPVELWLFSQEKLQDLVEEVETLSQGELHRFLLGKFVDDEGNIFYVLRELLKGKNSLELALQGEEFYMAPRLPGVFLPVNREIFPPIRSQRFRDLFDMEMNEFVLLRPREKQIQVLKLEEALFSPLREVIHYWIDSENKTLESRLPDIVFDFQKPNLLREEEVEESTPSPGGKKDVSPLKVQRESPSFSPSQGGASSERGRGSGEENLETSLLGEEKRPEGWVELARIKEEKGETQEAFKCWVEALWWAKNRQEYIEIAREGSQKGHHFPSFFFHLHEEEKILENLSSYYSELRSEENHFPKKLRWLFWEKLTEISDDEVERYHQGEALLSELNRAGLEDRDIPEFLFQALERELARKEASYSLNFLSHLSEVMDNHSWPREWRLALTSALANCYSELEEPREVERITDEIFREVYELSEWEEMVVVLATAGVSQIRVGQRGEEVLEEAFSILNRPPQSIDISIQVEVLGKVAEIISLLPREKARIWSQEIWKELEALPSSEQISLLAQSQSFFIDLSSEKKVRDFLLKKIGEEPSVDEIYPLLEGWLKIEDQSSLSREILKNLSHIDLGQASSFSEVHPHRKTYITVELSRLLAGQRGLDEKVLFTEREEEEYVSSLHRAIGIRFLIDHKKRGEALNHLQDSLLYATKIRDERHRLAGLVELIELIPLLGRPREGSQLLQFCMERQTDFQYPLHRTTLLNYCMKAVGRLGRDEETLQIWKELMNLLSQSQLLENSPLFFEVFTVGLEGLPQISSREEARKLLIQVGDILEEGMETFTQDVFLEANMYQAFIQYAMASLSFRLNDLAYEAIETLIPRLPQLLVYDPNTLQIYEDLLQVIVAMEDHLRYDYLQAIFDQFLPHFHRRGMVTREMVNLVVESLYQVFSQKSRYVQHVRRYKLELEEQIRKRIVENMYL